MVCNHKTQPELVCGAQEMTGQGLDTTDKGAKDTKSDWKGQTQKDRQRDRHKTVKSKGRGAKTSGWPAA